MRINLTWTDRQRRLNLRLAPGSKMLAPAKRNMVARMAGSEAIREIVFDGRPIEVRF